MEDEIENIVCRQISFDGDASGQIPTFKWFAEGSPDAPMTLVFDGYDEALQATGGVYRTLLNKIQKFQSRCRSMRRPVRIIVTSRETLIDKAEIPEGTVVMKLLEFDSPRKDQWIGIWNAHNHTILSEAGICDFSLSENSQDIDDLSSQPLLLIMLAMYDSDFETGTNALKPKGGQVEKLDRTKLYDELLRRFVRRELRKGHRGNEVPFDEREEAEKILWWTRRCGNWALPPWGCSSGRSYPWRLENWTMTWNTWRQSSRTMPPETQLCSKMRRYS